SKEEKQIKEEIPFKINIENYCERKIRELNPEENILPEIDEDKRVRLLFSALSTPVLMLKEPAESKCGKFCQSFKDSNPWVFVNKNAKYLKNNQQIGREIFLREGYFYNPNVTVAQVMGQIVSIDMLFNSDKLWLNRGSDVFELE